MEGQQNEQLHEVVLLTENYSVDRRQITRWTGKWGVRNRGDVCTGF